MSMLRDLTQLELDILKASATRKHTIEDFDRIHAPTPTAQTVTFLFQEGLLENPTNEAGTRQDKFVTISEKGERHLEQYASGKRKPKPNPKQHEKIPEKELPAIAPSAGTAAAESTTTTKPTATTGRNPRRSVRKRVSA